MTDTISRFTEPSSTQSINFNTAGSQLIVTNITYTTPTAIGIQEKPFTGPDLIYDLGVSEIVVIVTGFMPKGHAVAQTLATWLREEKTTTTKSFGRFSLDFDPDVWNVTANSTKGYVLFDGQLSVEPEPQRIAFVLKFRFNGTW